ncbi:MAG TPA: alanine--tRNA ligase, partial [Bacteroidia bacterium]|nr:alanine--tRNA ligase [Bacteroidia bacterium]
VINIAMRVIADHVRAISFAIADGQLPSNTGAGYVIRRILRRAVRYGYQSLNLRDPFICRLVPVLVNEMGEFFPELNTQKELIAKVIREEESAFYRTLETGLKKIDAICIQLANEKKSKTVPGKEAFELYDTFGFPFDLTALIARGYGLEIDEEEFKKELEKQKDRSRAATSLDTDDWVELLKDVTTNFIGYSELESDAKIIRYRKIKSKGKESFQLVLDVTPFYAESGGQVGDTGWLETANEKVRVYDTKKENGVIVHFTDKLPSDPSKMLHAKVDAEKRALTADNHSATHLLHAALRKVLGTHVEQKGSLVNDEYLRFDFSHFQKMTDEEIAEVEHIVNEKIRANISSVIREMAIGDAKKLGAMALFGEKYGDVVRVVTFDENYSIELCGGTHVKSTGEIGFFKITGESAIAAGIRRIEAITSVKAEQFLHEQLHTMREIREALKNPKDLVKSVQQLLEEKSALEKQVDALLRQKAKTIKSELIGKAEKVNGIHFIAQKIDLGSAEAIKDLAFELRNQLDPLFLVLGAEVNGKASLTLMISDDLVKEKKLNAGQIIRDLAKEIQGGGGGQPFFATSGGSNVAGIPKALEKAKAVIS